MNGFNGWRDGNGAAARVMSGNGLVSNGATPGGASWHPPAGMPTGGIVSAGLFHGRAPLARDQTVRHVTSLLAPGSPAFLRRGNI